MDRFYAVLRPLMVLVGWIMTGTHWVASQFLDGDSGLAWVLSIVALVIVMRIGMIPLFVKQIRSSRNMQLVQPELQKIQKKYKGKTDPLSRRRQQEEMMALYRRTGTNPMSSCLPVLVQSPFFVALFGVLNQLRLVCTDESFGAIGTITPELACSAQSATLFGAPLSSTFMAAGQATDGASPLTVRIVTVALIVLMSVTTFVNQHQLTMKNIPAAAQDNPMFRTQKMMLYVMPLVFAFSGVNFPIGVLVYWSTTNLWSLGQQFIVIRRMPAPGSEAERMLEARRARKGLGKGGGKGARDEGKGEGGAAEEAKAEPVKSSGQRVQPKKASRSQRKGGQTRGTVAPSGGKKVEPKGAETGASDGGISDVTRGPVDEGSGAGEQDPPVRGKPKRSGRKAK
jgi:YidC/Oxa1 family membrane protein insertase